MNITGRTVAIFYDGNAGIRVPAMFLNAVQSEGREVYKACRKLANIDFVLVSIDIDKWNEDMSPWRAEPVMRGAAPFEGGADRYLNELICEIIPKVEKELTAKPLYYGLAGYSLGGLFALYSIYQTDIFVRIASVSGSFWFPGFLGYVSKNKSKAQVRHMYISLGNLESKTRNPILSTVGDNTEWLVEHYKAEGIDVVYEENQGNHFCQPVERMAKGIVGVLKPDGQI